MELEFRIERRMEFLLGPSQVLEYYRALRSWWDVDCKSYTGGVPAAVVIHPPGQRSSIGQTLPLDVPAEILKMALKKSKTLILAAGTLESPLSIVQYLQRMKELYDIRL